MFFIFISMIGVLQCVPTTNREALRTKLLNVQNFMQFDQTEFNRLWNLGMSNGSFKIIWWACKFLIQLKWRQGGHRIRLFVGTRWAEKTGLQPCTLFHMIFWTFVKALVNTIMEWWSFPNLATTKLPLRWPFGIIKLKWESGRIRTFGRVATMGE